MPSPLNLQVIIAAVDKMTKPMGRMSKNFLATAQKMQGAGKVMAGAGVAITGAFGIAIKKTADLGDQLDKMSARTGASVDFLNQMGFVARRSGSSLGAIEKGFKTLSTQLVTADRATEATINAFKDLGVDINDLKGRNPEEVFEEMLKAVAAVPDEMKRAGIASELFGRAGIQLLPIFASGADGMDQLMERAKELGGTGLGPAAQVAAAFKDALEDLGFSATNTITKAITPLLKTLIPLVLNIVKVSVAIGRWASEHPTLTKFIMFATAALGGLMLALGSFILLAPGLLAASSMIATGLGGMTIAQWAAAKGAMALNFALAPMTLIVLGIVAAIGLLIAAAWLIGTNWDKISKWLGETWDKIKKGFAALVEWFKKNSQQLLDIFLSITMPWLKAAQMIITHWDKIKDFFGNLIGMAKDWGRNLMINLWTGIKEMSMKPVNAIRDMVQKIREFLPFSEPKRGALRGITKVGGKIQGAISEGLEKSARGFNVMSGGGAGGSKTFAITITTDQQIDGRIETQVGRFVDALRGMA
mgnify:CR=1 FL=1